MGLDPWHERMLLTLAQAGTPTAPAAAAGSSAQEAVAAAEAEKAEVDSRSIFIGNVDYGCDAGELMDHFKVSMNFTCIGSMLLHAEPA